MGDGGGVTCCQGDQVSVTCEKKSLVPSGQGEGGCMSSLTAGSGDFAAAHLLLLHTSTPHRGMTHFCELQLKHHGG